MSPESAAQILNHWTTLEVPLFFFFFKGLFIYFWLSQVFIAASRTSLVVESGGYSLTAVHGLLIAVASLSGERKLQGAWASEVAAPGLQSTGSIIVGHQLSCCGIWDLPELGLRTHVSHLCWQTLYH